MNLMSKPWEGYYPPFKIIGNVYFVGTVPASTHIIDTGDGLILIDSGYIESLYLVLHNIYKVGLDPMNIKYIVHTHGHIDHFGATKALKELTGAKTFLGRADAPCAEGKVPLSYAPEYNMDFAGTFTPDVLLDDGSIIELGNAHIECVSTPGHTLGTTTFFFDVKEGEKTFHAALMGGIGVNTMRKDYLDKYGLSMQCRNDFFASMDKIKDRNVDVYLGNHMHQNNTKEKAERLRQGEKYAFVNPSEWHEACENAKKKLLKEIEENG